jgi:glycosyltransferase involved in cell wall biosynthesis
MVRRILFIVPYPLGESPSQRFRFEQYFSALKEAGFDIDVQSFLNSQNWQVFFKPGNALLKTSALLHGFLRRFGSALKLRKYDFVFIHREATPVGPPVFEWFVSRVLRKKIIYDFDDAIWQTDRFDESALLGIVKWRSKVSLICRWSHKISCGNQYLQTFALQFNANAFVNPTTIDTDQTHNIELHNNSGLHKRGVTIGWTGSHSTLKYLKEIESTCIEIQKTYPQVNFTIIADKKPTLNFSFTFIPWNIATEISDLLTFDIGVMPLPDDEWSKGKCGFKILQYMALKIPAVASPVGVNTEIIQDEVSGFLCKETSEWVQKLSLLITDSDLRRKFGLTGYQKVINFYSVRANTRNFLKLFE